LFLGFESFCIGSAVAIVTISLWQRHHEQMDALRSLAIAGLLTVTFFCHLVPWAFAAGTIGVLALTGSARGRARRIAWSVGILLTSAPFFLIYLNLTLGQGGGVKLDWSHLEGFHVTQVHSWAVLLHRVDCIGLMRGLIPGIGRASPWENPAKQLSPTAVVGTLFNPFVILTAGVVLQALGTLLADVKSRDYRHIGWFAIGFSGVCLAVFMPDGTNRIGSFLPLRVMMLSLTMLIAYVRFDVGRVLTVGTGLLMAAGFALHTAAVCDYAVTANRQLLELKTAAATIPPGQRIYQIRQKQSTLRFQADPLRHADGYVAVWSHGILLSNYEAEHYYFPVKLRSEYRRLGTLATDLENLDPRFDLGFVEELLADCEGFIDVLVVRTIDEQILSLTKSAFRKVLWHHGDLWVLARK
jgi:hypothetical protein